MTATQIAPCSCHHCIDGWLSPRMKERLEGEADFLRYATTSIIDDISNLTSTDLIPEWCIAADTSLHYVPMDLQPRMTLAFYRGYSLVMEVSLQILLRDVDDNSCIPTIDAVQARLGLVQAQSRDATADPTCGTDAEDIRTYFDAGGQIDSALEALVDRAYERSPEGPEYGRKPMFQEEERDFEKEIQELPHCVHDLDFTLVRTKLGLSPHSNGPHWFFLTDDEDSEGSDEDGEAIYEGQQN